MRKFSICLCFVFVILFGNGNFLREARGAAPAELQDAISQKSQELRQISDQIKENQKNLESVQNQSKTLQQEIKSIDSNINGVNLSVRSSEVLIDKLELEIDSLSYNIDDAKQEITTKQEAVVKLLQEFQERDRETPLLVFLKNKSLADSVSQIQSLVDLDVGLSNEVQDLKNAKIILSNQLQEAADKKELTEAEKENLKNKQIILSDTKKEKQVVFTQSKSQEQIYQKTIDDLSKRQTEIANEIEKMDAEMRLKINPSSLPAKVSGVLAMPIAPTMPSQASGCTLSNCTQGYGATSFAKYGYKGKWHNGVDFAASLGTPVYSAEKGRVIAVGNQDSYCYRGAYGKFIVIAHENNLTTLYGHLSLQIVKVGDIVNRGQLIGYSGKTGYATGPHLHLTVYDSQTFYMGSSRICGPMPYGGDLNPMDYL